MSEIGMAMRVGMNSAVRAAGAAGLGAGAQRLVNNALDGARAAAAFGAAAETAIDLLGIPGEVFRAIDRTADIVVGQDVAGTNNHENADLIGDAYALRYVRPPQDAKGKTAVSSNSKLTPMQTGMNLKCLRQ